MQIGFNCKSQGKNTSPFLLDSYSPKALCPGLGWGSRGNERPRFPPLAPQILGIETFPWAGVFHCAKFPELPFSRVPHGPKRLLEPPW